MAFDSAALPAAQAAMMKQMYGDKFTMVFAVFDKRFALTAGKQGLQDMKDLIDRVLSKGKGLAEAAPFLAAAGPFAKTSGGFMYLSLAKMITAGLQNSYATMGVKNPEVQKLPPAKSGLFMDFACQPDRFTLTLRLPAEHLKETGEAVRAMMSMGR
jgi:hypothetical protein